MIGLIGFYISRGRFYLFRVIFNLGRKKGECGFLNILDIGFWILDFIDLIWVGIEIVWFVCYSLKWIVF